MKGYRMRHSPRHFICIPQMLCMHPFLMVRCSNVRTRPNKNHGWSVKHYFNAPKQLFFAFGGLFAQRPHRPHGIVPSRTRSFDVPVGPFIFFFVRVPSFDVREVDLLFVWLAVPSPSPAAAVVVSTIIFLDNAITFACVFVFCHLC